MEFICTCKDIILVTPLRLTRAHEWTPGSYRDTDNYDSELPTKWQQCYDPSEMRQKEVEECNVMVDQVSSRRWENPEGKPGLSETKKNLSGLNSVPWRSSLPTASLRWKINQHCWPVWWGFAYVKIHVIRYLWNCITCGLWGWRHAFLCEAKLRWTTSLLRTLKTSGQSLLVVLHIRVDLPVGLKEPQWWALIFLCVTISLLNSLTTCQNFRVCARAIVFLGHFWLAGGKVVAVGYLAYCFLVISASRSFILWNHSSSSAFRSFSRHHEFLITFHAAD